MKALIFLICVYGLSAVNGEPIANSGEETEKQLSPFFVVQFPNDPCNTTNNKVGTCLTEEACSNNGGESLGECAQGYGVCCVVQLECGKSSSVNNTYMTFSGSKPSTSCSYSICKLKDTICRIRLDFVTFDIADQETGTAGTGAKPTTNGGSLGQCVTDAFTFVSPGKQGSPVICGYNTGQHMILDAPEQGCVTATFVFGSTTTSRSYDIRASQYQCGSEAAGSPGCLQYFTGTSGTVANFGYPTSDTSVSASTTHLANQKYVSCWRRESGYCALCFYPKITGSFGLSISADDAAAQSVGSASCDSDYITIPFGTPTASDATSKTSTKWSLDRHCGRFFAAGSIGGSTSATTICTGVRPFQMLVHFDSSEVVGTGTADMATKNEQSIAPGGIIGFYLSWEQKKCT